MPAKPTRRVVKYAGFALACYLGLILGDGLAGSYAHIEASHIIPLFTVAPLGLLVLIALRPGSGLTALAAVVGGFLLMRKRVWAGVLVAGVGMAIASYLCASAWHVK